MAELNSTKIYGDLEVARDTTINGDIGFGGNLNLSNSSEIVFGDTTKGMSMLYESPNYVKFDKGPVASVGSSFYITSDIPITYIYSPSIYLGSTSGTTIIHRGNTLTGDDWSLTGGGALSLGDSTGNQGNLYLYGSTAAKVAEIKCTDGNLYIDADDSTSGIYLNYSGGTGGTIFGDGASGSSGASVSSAGVITGTNVTSGSNPGHTHTIYSPTAGSTSLTTTGTLASPGYNALFNAFYVNDDGEDEGFMGPSLAWGLHHPTSAQGGYDAVELTIDDTFQIRNGSTFRFSVSTAGLVTTTSDINMANNDIYNIKYLQHYVNYTGYTELYDADANTGWYWQDTTRDVYLYDDGVSRFKFDVDLGTFDADGDVIAYSSAVGSDKRLKRKIEIVKSSESLDKILKLQGISYERIEKPGERRYQGYIADEVVKFMPEVVAETNLIGHEGEGLFKTIHYVEMIPTITEGMKEQQKIINSQQKEIDELKEKLDEILEKLDKK